MFQICLIHASEFVRDGWNLYNEHIGFTENSQLNCFRSFSKVDEKRYNLIAIDSRIFIHIQEEQITAMKQHSKLLVLGNSIDAESISYFINEKGANGFLLSNEGYESIARTIVILKNAGIYCPYDYSTQLNQSNKSAFLFSLSKREKEIIHLVRIEKTNREISLDLGIHVKTVEMHKRNILEKTDRKKMLGAIDFLLAKGVIPRENPTLKSERTL